MYIYIYMCVCIYIYTYIYIYVYIYVYAEGEGRNLTSWSGRWKPCEDTGDLAHEKNSLHPRTTKGP